MSLPPPCSRTFSLPSSEVPEAPRLHPAPDSGPIAGAVPGPAGSNITCHPHVASWKACYYGGDPKSFHPYGPNVSYSYPTLDVLGGGFTWPGAMFSGMLPRNVAQDLLQFSSQYGAWTMIAPRRAGQLPFYCPFAQLGHGYGMLLHDMVERFLIFSFAMGGTAYTPGTWTAAECAGHYDDLTPTLTLALCYSITCLTSKSNSKSKPKSAQATTPPQPYS